MGGPYMKDPEAVIDYSIDWQAGYLLVGEQITASSWFIMPQGAVSDLAIDQIPAIIAGVASVFVKSGVAGKSYQLTNRITTNQGRTDERSLTIKVEQI